MCWIQSQDAYLTVIGFVPNSKLHIRAGIAAYFLARLKKYVSKRENNDGCCDVQVEYNVPKHTCTHAYTHSRTRMVPEKSMQTRQYV